MRNLRKFTAFLLTVVMVAGMLVMPGSNVQAAKKRKVQLNKKTVTLEVGKKVTLKLKNAPKKKKITWSSNKKKVASVSKKGVVTAKKAGKAKITAKVSGKKYVCKVTVKKKKKQAATTEAATQQNATTKAPKPENPTTPTTPEAPKPENPTTPTTPDKPSDSDTPTTPDKPSDSDKPTTPDKPSDSDKPTKPADITLTNTEGKNLDDVAALQEIIKEKNEKGATIPTDANLVAKCEENEEGDMWYTSGYIWNSDGRLEGIYWVNCNMQGSITLEKLSALKTAGGSIAVRATSCIR